MPGRSHTIISTQRVSPDGVTPGERVVPVEMPIAISFLGLGYAVMMATPADLKDFDVAAWIGYAAPIGTPRDVVARLSAEMQKVMQAADFRDRMLGAGLDLATPPDDYAAFMRREQERYAAVIKSANIKIE